MAAQIERKGQITVLDIGCGNSFDDDPVSQTELLARAGTAIGVEPAPDVEVQSLFSSVHRTTLELAPIRPASIDVAYAVMVLEHLENPEAFWNKLSEVLAPGGIFIAFTVDARHWFRFASQWIERLGLKNWYLRLRYGLRGKDRWLNYPTHYKSNSPIAVSSLATKFSKVDVQSWYYAKQVHSYFPKYLRWVATGIERITRNREIGSLLVVRAIR